MPRVPVMDTIIKELIAMVQDTKFVYDMGDKRHADQCQVRGFWEEVAESLDVAGMNASAWRSRWKNLRDTYIKHRKKLGSNRGFSGVNKNVKWKYFDQMSFLDPYIQSIALKDEPLSEESQESDAEKTEVADENESSMSNGSEIHDDSALEKSSPCHPNHVSPKTPGTATRKRHFKDGRLCSPVTSHLSAFKKLRHESAEFADPDPDPDFLLFQSYALRMKNLPQDAQALIKLQMSQIFYSIENPHLPPVPLASFNHKQHEDSNANSG